jgi:FG-GAP-like repeat/Stigma-specific protein, Stig1
MTARLSRLALLVALASCRGGATFGEGASCDESHPCRPHYTCSAGACTAVAEDAAATGEVAASVDGPDGDAPSDTAEDAPADTDGDAPGDTEEDAREAETGLDAAACTPACRPDEGCCDGRCVNLTLDPAHCGACGVACVGSRATEACIDGACIVAKCEPGWADCNDDPLDGCEASLVDLATCGSCGLSCHVPNGTSACVDGQCAPVRCNRGFAAQDGRCLACARPVVALCGRGSEGIVCASANPDGTLAPPMLYTTDFNDADGWRELSRYATIAFPDVDGDGQTDVCGRTANGVWCGLGNGGKRFEAATQWTSAFENPFWGGAPVRYMSLQFPDVNGDRKADLCAHAPDNLLCLESDGHRFLPAEDWTDAFGIEATWALNPSYWGTLQFPDLDGDGRADVCSRMADGVRCGESDSRAFSAVRKWSSGDLFSDDQKWTDLTLAQTIQFPDVDGDGRPDVCSRTHSSVACQPALETGAFGNAFELKDIGEPLQFPDIDGDGKADMCGRQPDGLWCALSMGHSFLPSSLAAMDFSDVNGFKAPLYAESIQFADLDGDGADDVCGRRKDGIVCAFSDRMGHFVRPALLAAFTDAEGWAKPEYASTLALVYLKRDPRRDCDHRPVATPPRPAAHNGLWDVLGVPPDDQRPPPGAIVGPGGLALDIGGANTAVNTPIIGWDPTGSSNDTWVRNGLLLETSLGGGRCLNIPGGMVSSGFTPITSWDCVLAAPNEQFHFLNVEWRALGNTCVAAESATAGAHLSIATCDGSDLQHWDFLEGDQRIKLHSGALCVAVPNGDTTLGTEVTLAVCGQDQQTFGFNRGRLDFSGACLNVLGGTAAAGSRIGLSNGCTNDPVPRGSQFSLSGQITCLGQCITMGGPPELAVAIGMSPCVPGAPSETWEYFW